jgi:hypothetical protein
VKFQQIKNIGWYNAMPNYGQYLTPFAFLEEEVSEEIEMQIHRSIISIEQFIGGEIHNEFR